MQPLLLRCYNKKKYFGRKILCCLAYPKRRSPPGFPVKIAYNGKFHTESVRILDDVFCRCLVMQDGTQTLIFLSYDLLFHDREPNNALAEYARQRYGVAPSAVVVSYTYTYTYTHAHTTPATRGYNPSHHHDGYEAYLVEKGKLCFIGYTDACAYVVSDGMLDEGGYEPNAFLEYCLIGPFEKGLDEKYRNSFQDSLNRLRR